MLDALRIIATCLWLRPQEWKPSWERCRETRHDCYVPIMYYNYNVLQISLVQSIPGRKVHVDAKANHCMVQTGLLSGIISHRNKIATIWLLSWFMMSATSSTATVLALQHCSCKSQTFQRAWNYAVAHTLGLPVGKSSPCAMFGFAVLQLAQNRLKHAQTFCFWCQSLCNVRCNKWDWQIQW